MNITPKIKLAIADDQVLFLKGLRALLTSFEEIDLIIEATNGAELLEAIDHERPDVILLDLRMPVMDGLEATEKIRATYPDIKIILLTTYDEEYLINNLMKVGANGYLVKNEELEVLLEAIHTVMAKGYYFNDYVSKALLSNVKKKNKEIRPWRIAENLQLTKREMEVLHLICRAFTSAEIAEELFISIRTVENHRKSLLSKTGMRNTAGLIIYAIRDKLIEIDLDGF